MKNILLALTIIALVGCQTVTRPGVAIGPRGPVEPEQYLFGRLPVANILDANGNSISPYVSFETAYTSSANDWDDRGKAEVMLLSGFAFSELLCDRYFNILANNNQDLGFGTESLAIGSGLTASVLGLTQSPAKSIALVASGFSATIAGMEAFQQHYYFGPDVSTVRQFVMDGMANYRSTVVSSDLSGLNHFSAKGYVQRMQSICQVDSIKSYVDQAVANQKISFSTGAREDFFSRVSLDVVSQLSRALGSNQTLSPQDITYLYMLSTGDTNAELNKVIKQRLDGLGLNGLIDANGLYSPPANATVINQLFMSLPVESRSALQARASSIRSDFQAAKDAGKTATESDLASEGVEESSELREEVTTR